MEPIQLHEDKFLRILWDDKTQIIAIDWKESTGAMTGEHFKAELVLFADRVEQKSARRILVDVSHFGHKMSADVPSPTHPVRPATSLFAIQATLSIRLDCKPEAV